MKSSTHKILIIDDEPDIRELLSMTISRMGFDGMTAACVAEARDLLSNHNFQLCLTDMRLPDGDGLDMIRHIQQHYPQTPVAVITAYGNVELAIDSLKAGAFDFISKPLDIKRLRSLVTTAVKLDAGADQAQAPGDLLGDSSELQALRQQVLKLARSQAPVHIRGESGSGKEVVARMIHNHGPRSEGAFVPVNCGAIPPELVESELFGHTKGSFTGAHADKSGLFEQADGGTLFLDEIGDLPQPVQVKLLRAIQEKRVRPVGAGSEVPVDVRLLSATHKDLSNLVEQGEFRTDLFYRINVIEVTVPPLREHAEDIPLLANAILARITAEWDMPAPSLSDAAMTRLCQYEFPGNVRELENILERAIALCEGGVIQPDDFQLDNAGTESGAKSKEAPLEFARGDMEGFIQSQEKHLLLSALERTGGNKTEAAAFLGLSFRQFRYKLKKLGLDSS